MSIDVFSIHCDGLAGAKLAGFKGVEGLNRPFEMDVFFTVPVGTDVKAAVGARATLTADRDDGRGPMRWHGVFAKMRLLHETAERALYRAALVPRMWLLRQYVRNYVHTKKKVDTILADTLKDAGLSPSDFQFSTNAAAYPQEEFVCQYRESHLDFVHRWCEREGLYYYFEHPESEGATEKLVIVDDKAQHHPLFGKGQIRYVPSLGQDGSAGECFRELSADFDLLPASVMISDYNYANPSAPLSGEKAVSGTGQGLIREYGYRVFNEGEAARLAAVKAQSMGCREIVLSATGDALGVRAGYTFEVEDAPADLPAKYLAIEVRHAGALAGASSIVRRYVGLETKETYRVDVVAIPSNVQFRAPQTTQWPRIYGFENGSVDGPAESQYAQIDDQGRYLVRFKFDASDLPDGSTSTYLRMMQPHGGTTEGWHFPLRKGTEVMVSFQGGDPDRPVIAGVVPNAVQPSNVTSKNHTQNVLKTGGGNLMIMDDQEGIESINFFTPVGNTEQMMGKHGFIKIRVPTGDPKGDSPMKEIACTYWMTTDETAVSIVGKNLYQSVGACYFLDVAGDVTAHYGGTQILRVDGVSTEYFNADRKTVTTGLRRDDIHGGLFQTIESEGIQHVQGKWIHSVSGREHDIYGSWASDITGSWTAEVGAELNIRATGNATIVSTGGNVEISSFGGEAIVFSPSKVRLLSPEVESTAATHRDTVGTAMEHCIYKHDTAAIMTAQMGVTIVASGVKLETTGFERVSPGTVLEGTALKIANRALNLLSGGFHKIG